MSGVGFSIPQNAGIDAGHINSVLDAQISYANNSVAAEEYKARAEAVGYLVAALISKDHQLSRLDDVVTAITKIGAALKQI